MKDLNRHQKILKELFKGPKSSFELIKATRMVDVRKAISNIRRDCEEYGYTIVDIWETNEKTGKRYKVYFAEKLKKSKKKK